MKILVISDLHVGSKYAVAPKMAVVNPIQKQLYKWWEEMCRENPEVDYLLVNGDIVEGDQPAEEGRDLSASNLDDQLNQAEELVKMIDFNKMLVTYGSPYHVKRNPPFDLLFARMVGADAHGYELNFRPQGHNDVIHLTHHISTSMSGWQYRTTAIAKELVLALLQEKELYRYKSLIRSHAHYYCYVAFTDQFGIITPCWQTRTPYQIRKGFALVPKIGYVTITVEDGVWSVIPYTHQIPRPELVTL